MKRSAIVLSAHAVAVTVAAVLVVGAAACGGGGSVDDFVNQLAKDRCDWRFKCCKDAEVMQLAKGRYTDAKTCLPFELLAVKDALNAEHFEVAQGRMKVDGNNASACLAANAALACNQPDGQPAVRVLMGADPCNKVFIGAVTAGNECRQAANCAAGTKCVTLGGGGQGVCEPLQKEGEICNVSNDCDQSDKALYCRGTDFKCAVPAALGQPCQFTSSGSGNPSLPLLIQCDQTLAPTYCDPVAMTCKRYPSEGQPCLSNTTPGILGLCDTTPSLRLICDQSTTICRAPGKLGADCSKIACDATLFLFCDRNGGNVCAALPSVGEPCRSSGICKAPYTCDFAKGTCKGAAQLGESCQGTQCELNLYCDNTFYCKNRLGDGATCNQSSECVSNSCGFVGNQRACTPSNAQPICSGR